MYALDSDYLRSCLEYIFNSILRKNNPLELALGTIALLAEIIIYGTATFDNGNLVVRDLKEEHERAIAQDYES